MRRCWKVHVIKGRLSGLWHWRLEAGNGQILAYSETYSSHRKALKTAKVVWMRTDQPCKLVDEGAELKKHGRRRAIHD